jgi:YVTN family beta-propeller protein
MRSHVPHTNLWLGAGLALLLGACGGGSGDDDDDAVDAGVDSGAPHAVAKHASKSGSIAITDDNAYVVMINPEAGSVTVFDTATDAGIEVPTGSEPGAVVLAPDSKTAYVSNRGDATVVKITGLDTASPDVGEPVGVGSEPTGLALSPSGATLYVAEWAEGRIGIIDTDSMTETASIDAPKNPRVVSVTNDGDQDDDDELIIVPEFYGEPTGTEGTDTSRTARIRLYSAADLSPQTPILLDPIDSGFFPETSTDTTTVMTSPNQLWNVVPVGTKLYLPTISASPAPPLNFRTNVEPVVFVADLETGAQDNSALGTVNLAKLVRDQVTSGPRFFLADIVDIAFVGDQVMYVLSRGADVLQRVHFDTGEALLGSGINKQIDLNVIPAGSTEKCQTPTGVVIGDGGSAENKGYVNCWGTRQLGVVDFTTQELAVTVQSAGTDVSEADAKAGRHFYFTARGRWSKEAWSDCGSCHPDGLSDNMTWYFDAGPRQTTSMDGSFSHFAGEAQKQRIFNWTGIFDEIHDFERNTRGVSGGLGAVTNPPAAGSCGDITTEVPATLAGGLATPVRGLQNCTTDWDKIETFSKTIRPPRALQKLDTASVDRGRALFGEGGSNGGCVRCHGGDGWTASRLYATPQLAADAFTQPGAWPGSAAGTSQWNFHTLKVATQPTTAVFGGSEPEATTSVAPPQVACVLRNVVTFGSAALEVKNHAVNGTPGARAQGRLGYNVPSLYGVALGAPYLHHGGASSLEDLLDGPAWAAHATAGNPNWLSGDATAVAQRKADVIAFLLSIDAFEAEQDLPGPPTGPWDGCP